MLLIAETIRLVACDKTGCVASRIGYELYK